MTALPVCPVAPIIIILGIFVVMSSGPLGRPKYSRFSPHTANRLPKTFSILTATATNLAATEGKAMTKPVETANVYSVESANLKIGESKGLQAGVQSALFSCAYEGCTAKFSSTPVEKNRKPTDQEMVEIKHETKDIAKGKWGAQSIKQFEHVFNKASKEQG